MIQHTKGRLEYHPERGVVYFFGEKGECHLRIEGVTAMPQGYQLDIHLVSRGDEHHHEGCRGKFTSGAVPGMVCAVKLP